MGSFMGGSAPAMARQICNGYTHVSPGILKRLTVPQLEQLQFELDKALRDSRGEQVSLDDQAGLQARNRRISRIEGSLRVLRGMIQERRRRRM